LSNCLGFVKFLSRFCQIAQNKENRHQQIIKELTEEGINRINENWILFNKENPGRHISEHLSPKQKLKIMNCYKDFIFKNI